MMRTIELGDFVSVQGIFVKELKDGRVAVDVEGSTFSGKPVSQRHCAEQFVHLDKNAARI